jgi:peptidoglycan/xylan/chitin deacetylase (PgdA/CDA1 family)
VAITIDDGYEDTYSVFYEYAKKHQIPFTLFLSTNLSVQEKFGKLPRPTFEQLREMGKSGLVTFGLHGHSHQFFTEVFSAGREEEEIVASEEIIMKELGVTPEVVAYPSGRYDETVLKYFRERPEYIGGVTIHSGFVRVDDDPFRLRRVEVSRNTPTKLLFTLRLTPALDVYNKLKQKLK